MGAGGGGGDGGSFCTYLLRSEKQSQSGGAPTSVGSEGPVANVSSPADFTSSVGVVL